MSWSIVGRVLGAIGAALSKLWKKKPKKQDADTAKKDADENADKSQDNGNSCTTCKRPAQRPNKRHDPCKTSNSDRTKEENTMIEPGTDVAGDMEKINAGDFEQVGNDLLVNGRTYGQHSDTGVTYPKSGPGFVDFDRVEHKFLKDINTNGLEAAKNQAKYTPGLTEEKMNKVIDLWEKC